jgi:putative ABC transport system permease protein
VLADRDLGQDKFEGVALGAESNRVFVPLASARARFRFQPMEDEVDRFLLRIDDPSQLGADARVLGALLDQRHGGAGDYTLVVPQQLYRQNQKTQRIFSIVMGSIAGVSLLVGGIGIMNIMLVSVTERTREIGIRLAIGAEEGEIQRQFLLEAIILTSLGGLIGMTIGLGGSFALTRVLNFPFVASPMIAVISVGFSAIIGVIFGYVPARRAARLDPIEALRYE